MRTTIRLDEKLMRAVRALASESGRTFTAVVEESLREALARRRSPPKHPRIRLPTFAGDGLAPGVDLDDSGGLLDRMDGRRGPS